MILTILRGLFNFIVGSGTVLLNIEVNQRLAISPIMEAVTWALASGVSIITFLYLRSLWIKTRLEIKEKRKNLYQSKIPKI